MGLPLIFIVLVSFARKPTYSPHGESVSPLLTAAHGTAAHGPWHCPSSITGLATITPLGPQPIGLHRVEQAFSEEQCHQLSDVWIYISDAIGELEHCFSYIIHNEIALLVMSTSPDLYLRSCLSTQIHSFTY